MGWDAWVLYPGFLNTQVTFPHLFPYTLILPPWSLCSARTLVSVHRAVTPVHSLRRSLANAV